MSKSRGVSLTDLLAYLAAREADRTAADLREQLDKLTKKVERMQSKLVLLEVRAELMDSLPQTRR